MIHVRFEGRSVDLAAGVLNLRDGASDREVKALVAEYFDVGTHRLDGYVIDRPDTGVLIVRPEAVYG